MSDDYRSTQARMDREYTTACEEHGVDAAPNYSREYPVNVMLPVVDRGHRVNGAPLVDDGAGDDEPVEQIAPESTAEVIEEAVAYGQQRQAVLDEKLALFVAQSRNALEAGHRFAAVMMRSGEIGQKEMLSTWEDLTVKKLRRARDQVRKLEGAS